MITAWLLDKPSLPLRRTRLRVLASYLRWLRSADPAAAPLAAEHQVDSYCLAALTTGLPPSGRPLAKATVIRRGAVLVSFYAFARRARAIPPPHHGNAVRPPTPAERHLIRAGAAHLAGEGRLAAATAVALLEATGTTVTALARLTARDLHLVGGTELALITLHDDRDDLIAFPLSPHLRALAGKLCGDRPDGGPLITKDDGAQVDLEWMRDALTSAALAAGLHPQRARHLHPHLLRARTATDVIDRPTTSP
ncbi:MAG: hypothetical protein HOW71_19415 [Nonomuraea sp.]|nr:hypothetical protein [Nonomuraea sp.]